MIHTAQRTARYYTWKSILPNKASLSAAQFAEYATLDAVNPQYSASPESSHTHYNNNIVKTSSTMEEHYENSLPSAGTTL